MNELTPSLSVPQHESSLFGVTAITKLKHADLWSAVKKVGSAAALARHIGVSPSEIGLWLSLQKFPPAHPTYSWSEDRIALVEAKLHELTGKTWDELFPSELRNSLSVAFPRVSDERTIRMEETALLAYATSNRERLLSASSVGAVLSAEQQRSDIESAMLRLSARSRQILREMWGFDGEPLTLSAIGKKHGISGGRASQIALKAISRLRTDADRGHNNLGEYSLNGPLPLPVVQDEQE